MHRQETVDCLKKFNARRKLKVTHALSSPSRLQNAREGPRGVFAEWGRAGWGLWVGSKVLMEIWGSCCEGETGGGVGWWHQAGVPQGSEESCGEAKR